MTATEQFWCGEKNELKIWILFSTNLLLRLLKLSKGNKEVFLHVVVSEELDRPLVDLPAVSDVAMLLFKTSVFDPVLHFGMNHDECGQVKELLTEPSEH